MKKDNTIRKVQLIQLEILKEFDRICRKHNLKYILTGGTLIGAIRHNGFIPWDDDIDVVMLRKDYEAFLKIYEKEINKEKFYFQSIENNDKVIQFFAKIKRKNSVYAEPYSSLPIEEQGIWIDIFPADNTSDNKFIAKLLMIKVCLLKPILYFKTGNNISAKDLPRKIVLKLLKFYSHFTSIEKTKKKIIRISKIYNNKNTNTVAIYGGIRFTKEIIDKSYLLNITEHTFEDSKFYIPKDYDLLLKHFYGDYMKIPPENERINHQPVKIKLPNKK